MPGALSASNGAEEGTSVAAEVPGVAAPTTAGQQLVAPALVWATPSQVVHQWKADVKVTTKKKDKSTTTTEYSVDLEGLFPAAVTEAKIVLLTGRSSRWRPVGATARDFAVKLDGVEKYLPYLRQLQAVAWELAKAPPGTKTWYTLLAALERAGAPIQPGGRPPTSELPGVAARTSTDTSGAGSGASTGGRLTQCAADPMDKEHGDEAAPGQHGAPVDEEHGASQAPAPHPHPSSPTAAAGGTAAAASTTADEEGTEAGHDLAAACAGGKRPRQAGGATGAKRSRAASTRKGQQAGASGKGAAAAAAKPPKPEKANKTRPFTLFPVSGLQAAFVTFDRGHLDEVLALLTARQRVEKMKKAAAEAGASHQVNEEVEFARRVPHWWSGMHNGDALVSHVFNSDARRVKAPQGTHLSSVMTDGATAVLRFKGADRPPRRHPGGEALWESRQEAVRLLRKEPLPGHVTQRPVHEWSGITTMEHLAAALVQNLGRRRAKKVQLNVIGVDPGKRCVVYSTRLKLRAGARQQFTAGTGRYVTNGLAEELCEPTNRYRLDAAVHQQLKGRTEHQRKELAWRRACGVEDVFSAMGTYSWRSAEPAHLEHLLRLESQAWTQLMQYYFGENKLVRMGRRARFRRQRHEAVTANRLIGLESRAVGEHMSGRRWRRAQAKRLFTDRNGDAAWSRRFDDDGLRRAWEDCCEEAKSLDAPRTRRVDEYLKRFHGPAAKENELVVVAVGDGLFPSGMRGYAPSSHMPFVRQLARRPGVVVVFVDEYFTSKKCFVCGSLVEFEEEASGDASAVTGEVRGVLGGGCVQAQARCVTRRAAGAHTARAAGVVSCKLSEQGVRGVPRTS